MISFMRKILTASVLGLSCLMVGSSFASTPVALVQKVYMNSQAQSVKFAFSGVGCTFNPPSGTAKHGDNVALTTYTCPS